MESVALVAVSEYTPAVLGAVSTTGVPLTLCVALNDPPEGEMLHSTPARSLVVAASVAPCVTVSAALAGEIDTVMSWGLRVRVSGA